MEANPFAQMPSTPESIIAQVRRDLTAHSATMADFPAADLDRAAETAVRELWESRVKAFVPVLALRQARDMLYDRGTIPAEPVSVAPVLQAAAVPRRERDVLYVGDDVLRIDGDALPRND
jgi:hypothetical protein